MTGSVRKRWSSMLAPVAALLVVAAVTTPTMASAISSGSSVSSVGATPSCTFDNSSLPLVTGVSEGTPITVSCTGEKPNQLLVVAQPSLLIGLIPGVSSLFGGTAADQNKLLSLLKGLPSELAALAEIAPGSLHLAATTSTGTLDYTYVVPHFWALDHKATCPPSAQQFSEGLIGCALVLIDVNTVSVLPGGYALLSWQSNLLSAVPLNQTPTTAVSPTSAPPGSSVSLSDAVGATTYWWLATLAYLEGLLSGDTANPTVSVTVDGQPAISTASVSPAVYRNFKLSPPALSGAFTVPSGLPPGPHTVTVSLQATLLGIPLSQSASTTLNVS